MLFNSLQFLVFLPIVLVVYYRLGHRSQNYFLLAASCVFYGAWDWRFLAPLLITTSIDFWCARRMEDLLTVRQSQRALRPYVILSVSANLLLLGFFKYFNFFATNLQLLLQSLGWRMELWTLNIILPVGISFYTFQALSYTIDVYRGQLHATRNFADFLLCVIYFPHLVAGPIQRAHSLLPQVSEPRKVTREGVAAGIHLIIWGYAKKVFIADNLAPLVTRIFSAQEPSGFEVLMAVYAFAGQIYCDFSGYTDIARGIAKLMGFEFMLNFNLPYFAKNPVDFWNRWHISLSSWLRDYVYFSLGGLRKGKWYRYRNLFLTMLIGGLWHGANWTFVLWGAYHGAWLVGHRLLDPFLSRTIRPTTRAGEAAWSVVRILATFHLVCLGWLLFRADSLTQAGRMASSLLQPFRHMDPAVAARVLFLVLPLIAVQLIQYFTKRLEFMDFQWISPEMKAASYGILLYLVLFCGGQPQSFIYFQF